jgi:hypothetical protein
MFIVGLGVAAPPRCYAQRECWEALRNSAPFTRLTPRSRAIPPLRELSPPMLTLGAHWERESQLGRPADFGGERRAIFAWRNLKVAATSSRG